MAVCLPTTAGYVRCQDADGGAALPADEAFVSDSWTVADSDTTLTVTGVADRRQADRLIRVAGRAGLHVVHVALPQARCNRSKRCNSHPVSLSGCGL